MSGKKSEEMPEEELLQLADEYSKQMAEIMEEDEDEEACEKVFKKYIKIYERLAEMDFDKYAEVLMEKYSIFADFYLEATEYFNRGINVLKKRMEVCKKLAQTRPDMEDEIEISYEELGDVYDGFGFEKKADEMYSIAEEMKRKKEAENPKGRRP